MNKDYRNLTWVIVIVFSLVTLTLFSIIVSQASKIQKNINNSFNFALQTISKNDDAFSNINEAMITFNNSNPAFPLPNEEYMSNFKSNINKYIEDTKQRAQQI